MKRMYITLRLKGMILFQIIYFYNLIFRILLNSMLNECSSSFIPNWNERLKSLNSVQLTKYILIFGFHQIGVFNFKMQITNRDKDSRITDFLACMLNLCNFPA